MERIQEIVGFVLGVIVFMFLSECNYSEHANAHLPHPQIPPARCQLCTNPVLMLAEYFYLREDTYSLLMNDPGNYPILRTSNYGFHLHTLNHDEHLIFLNMIARLSLDSQDFAWHRG